MGSSDLQIMKELYEKTPNLELHVDRSGWNGLHHAAASGQIKPVEIMLYWNFDINAVTNENETPILLATRNGHKNLTSLLLDNGADPFIATRSKSSPLSEATKKNRPEIVELLQDAINSNVPSNSSPTSGNSGNNSMVEPVLAGGPTSTEFKNITNKLK